MFCYDQYLVGELLEHLCEEHTDLDAVVLYSDLERALRRLAQVNCAAHRLATLYSQGYSEGELAARYMVPEYRVRYALDAVFQALALILNGED